MRCLWVMMFAMVAAPTLRAGEPAAVQSSDGDALARSISTLIREAIPAEYEKRDDWGATKEIVVGLRATGNLRDFDLKRRRKTVNHGVWKHYRLHLIEPERTLAVQLTRLQSRKGGGIEFTLRIDASLAAWARAKVYEYGVHVVAVEAEGDARVTLEISGEVVLQALVVERAPAVAVRPLVRDARLTMHELRLRRISNARGPIVRQLGDGLARIVEEEVNGPGLVAKLNRAIEKKRDSLTFSAGDLLKSPWRAIGG
ncbi:MAG: hypothetical protein IT424_02780 [Pirellulales bacterium]|nr:hypothetical protein [Pirellulales bacterium]